MANTPPRATINARDEAGHARNAFHGRRQAANTSAAKKMRSHATPATGTRANSSTANDGPR